MKKKDDNVTQLSEYKGFQALQKSVGGLATITDEKLAVISKKMVAIDRANHTAGRSNTQTTNQLMSLTMMTDSPYRRLRQCLSQIEKKRTALEESYFKMQKKKVLVEQWYEKGDELSVIKAQEAESSMIRQKDYIDGAFKEIATFQCAYDEIRESHNIPEKWDERDAEVAEIDHHIKQAFRQSHRDVVQTGNITGGKIAATTDTAAGDNAAIGYTAAEGLILTGQGSTNDVTIKNDADADVLEIPTGTTTVTMTGALKPLTYQETYVSISAAATITCNLATGTSFATTMDENTTFVFSNPPASGTAFSFTLVVTQHSTAVTITWPNTVDWAGGSAPDAAGDDEVQAYGFLTRDGGTTYYGFLGGTAIG